MHGLSANDAQMVLRMGLGHILTMLARDQAFLSQEGPRLGAEMRANMRRMKDSYPRAPWTCSSGAWYEWHVRHNLSKAMQVPSTPEALILAPPSTPEAPIITKHPRVVDIRQQLLKLLQLSVSRHSTLVRSSICRMPHPNARPRPRQM